MLFFKKRFHQNKLFLSLNLSFFWSGYFKDSSVHDTRSNIILPFIAFVDIKSCYLHNVFNPVNSCGFVLFKFYSHEWLMLILLKAVSAQTTVSIFRAVSEGLVQHVVASCGSSATIILPLSQRCQVTYVEANHLHQDFMQWFIMLV